MALFFYDPVPNFFGVDTFTYVAEDFRASNVATVTINVTPKYDPATAEPDVYKAFSGQVFEVSVEDGVLANDRNPDRTNLQAILVDDVADGNLSLRENGSFTFDPLTFFGTTQFSYRIDDGTNLSEPVDVTLIINTPPEPRNDSYTIDEDGLLTVIAANGTIFERYRC